METTFRILVSLLLIADLISAILLPTFEDLAHAYPGYSRYGGSYTDKQIIRKIVGRSVSSPTLTTVQSDTTALRLSIALNELGETHRLGTRELFITKDKTDSYTGRNGMQYLYRTTAFGPFLARKYESPKVYYKSATSRDVILSHLQGRKGLLRIVALRRGLVKQVFDARIVLWECTRPFKSRDYTRMHHTISMEFWELKGLPCRPDAALMP